MNKVKKPKLTVKQAKIVKGKAAGEVQRKIGLEVYPNATPASASVLVSRELKKVNVQEALAAELEKQGITLERIVKPINDALDATKAVVMGRGDDTFVDIINDHPIRLKASGMAAQFMGIGKNTDSGTNVFIQGDATFNANKYMED